MPRIRKVVKARLYHFSKGNNAKALVDSLSLSRIFVVGQRGYFRKLYLVSSLEIVLFPIVFCHFFLFLQKGNGHSSMTSRKNGNERLQHLIFYNNEKFIIMNNISLQINNLFNL